MVGQTVSHYRIVERLGSGGTPYDRAFFLDALGDARDSLGDLERAERAYRDALAYNSHFALARYHLAMLLRRAGKTEESRRELEAFATEWKGADPSVPELKHVATLMVASGSPPGP